MTSVPFAGMVVGLEVAVVVIGWLSTALALDVSTEPLVQGDSADLTATAATPGATVEFVRGVGGVQTVLGQGIADAAGTATLTWSVPQGEPPGPGVLVAREGAVQSAPIGAPVYEVLRASRTVVTQADIDALAWLVRIDGAYLNIDLDPGITTVDLPRLVTVGSSLADGLGVSGGPDLVTVSLPALRSVYSDLAQTSGLPVRIEAPLLREVATLWMYGGEADLPAVQDIDAILVEGSSYIALSGMTHARMLTVSRASVVTVEGLQTAEDVNIEDVEQLYLPHLVWAIDIGTNVWGPTPPLQVLDMPQLERVQNLVLLGPTGATLTLPTLRSVWDSLSLGETDLVSISAPNLAYVDTLYVTDNADLQVLDLPSLTLGGVAQIYDNPLLPACDADTVSSSFAINAVCYANDGTCGVCY